MTWRYFKYSSLGPLDVYRWPANGKRLEQQLAVDVEIYLPDGSWQGPEKRVLFSESCSGWFDEDSDEISEGEALILMAKVSARAKAKESSGEKS